LTSDYLFRVDTTNGELLELDDQPQYHNLAVAPNGEIIIADYYSILKINGSLKTKEAIDSPIKMYMIKLKSWNEGILIFECDEFLNWERHLEMELDTNTWTIKIRE
jgi:hypothetical protein